MHIYKLGDNEYPSVTTIIKLISVNDELLKWANIMGFRHKDIKDIQEDSANFGTTVHSHLRAIVDQNAPVPIPFTDPRREYEWGHIKKKFLQYFNDIKYRTVDTEVTLISDTLGYGGTLDWLTHLTINEEEKLFLLDFKTSKKPRVSMFLQLGGYYKLLLEKGICVDGAGILITNERECSLHPIDRDELEWYGNAFISLFNFYKLWASLHSFTPNYDIVRMLKKQPVNV